MKARILLAIIMMVALAAVVTIAVAAKGVKAGVYYPVEVPFTSASSVRPRPAEEQPAWALHRSGSQPSAMVRAVTCDHLGTCWFPTWNGLDALSASGQWVHFGTSDGLGHVYCHDAAVDAAGRVWVGHHDVNTAPYCGASVLDYNGTLSNKADDRWQVFCEGDGLDSGWVESVEIGPDGHPWFGIATGSGGIRVLDHKGTPFDKSDDTWTDYTSDDIKVAGPVNAILFDGTCTWVGTDFGLAHSCGGWHEETWSGAGCPSCWPEWPVGMVWDLVVDDEGHVWMADGQAGAAEFDGTGWTVCDVEDPACGLPPDPDGTDSGVRSLAVDQYNNVWFGTRGGRGVARLDGHGDWTLFDQSEEGSWLYGAIDIEGIDFDLQGRGWFGGNGVYQYVVEGSSTDYVTSGSGGDVSSPDRRAKASFPPGSVDQDTEVTITPASSPPTGDRYGSYIFDMTAVISGTTDPVTSFDPVYTLVVRYTDSLRGGAIEDTLGLYWWDESASEWVLESSSTLDTTSKRVTATVDHMTYFGLLGDSNLVYIPLAMKEY